MRTAVRFIQVIVGLLFIVSGLVKANDPIGLSYKMQEFFELWSAGLSQGSFLSGTLTFFHNTSLGLSIAMITLEILAGVALLLGWQKKAILWLLLLALQWYVLNYLPLADCLPFKKGNHLPAYMKPPPGAVPDSFAIRFVYEKNGKQFEFAPENLPADFTTYKFIDRKQTLVRKGNAEAPIKGFTLTNEAKDEMTGNTIDAADSLLSQPSALLLFVLDFKNPEWLPEAKSLVKEAVKRQVPVAVVSPSFSEAEAAFAGIEGARFFNTDFTVVRTVARTNPTVLLLKKGTVEEKWSRKEMDKAAGYLAALNK